jgi:chemotaxis protein CheC
MTRPTFGPRQVDALQELTSIGCGAALTALGKLTRLKLDMDVPEAWIGAGAGAIASFLGALGSDLICAGVKLEGPLTGDLLLALPEPDAEVLALALGAPAEAGRFGQLAQSAIMESGNIVGSAFVSAVARVVGETLLLSVPTFARGSGKACVDKLVDHAGSVALATRFSSTVRPKLEGLILVMPEPSRISRLLAHLEPRS